MIAAGSRIALTHVSPFTSAPCPSLTQQRQLDQSQCSTGKLICAVLSSFQFLKIAGITVIATPGLKKKKKAIEPNGLPNGVHADTDSGASTPAKTDSKDLAIVEPATGTSVTEEELGKLADRELNGRVIKQGV